MTDATSNHILDALRNDVSRRYGKRIETATDFSKLSETILDSKAGYISPSTLKRFWGYVRDNYTNKRQSTLDTLARYIGYDNFRHYAATIERNDSSDSDYNTALSLDVQTIAPGSRIRVTWHPDRVLDITYKGDLTFTIDTSENSRLKPGMSFKCMTLVKGQPLIVNIIPDSQSAGAPIYIAGKVHGIDWHII